MIVYVKVDQILYAHDMRLFSSHSSSGDDE
jgi:hypothetical protein